jgi:hypothetical protein
LQQRLQHTGDAVFLPFYQDNIFAIGILSENRHFFSDNPLVDLLFFLNALLLNLAPSGSPCRDYLHYQPGIDLLAFMQYS